MNSVRVTSSKTYDVSINVYSVDEMGTVVKNAIGGDIAFVVSDSHVAPLYLDAVADSFAMAGYGIGRFVFEAGEEQKNLSTYGRLLDGLSEAGATRGDVVVALGGGVTGDMAGFAAATYMRGCRFVQIPTSLLAMVDSSVGGKTAVDLPAGKNLVGAFLQPDFVFANTDFLNTLEPHFFTDGCAEVIKYGAIWSESLFGDLETVLLEDDERLERVISECVSIKRDVVEQDERESGLRQILNFGHTLGHAIEKLSGFSVTHGYAVGCGMVLASSASCKAGFCSESDAERVRAIVRSYGLPVSLDDCGLGNRTIDDLYNAALADKKRHGDSINVIVLDGIGKVHVETMSLIAFRDFVGLALGL